jgi:hypothetical protein
VKIGTGHSIKKIIANETKKTGTSIPAGNIVNDKNSASTTAGKQIAVDDKIVSEKERADTKNSNADVNELTPAGLDKNKKINKDIVRFKENKESGESAGNLTKEKRNFAPVIEKINTRPVVSIQKATATGLKIPAVIDSLLKNSIAKNITQERIHHFKPYWTVTCVVTYDRLNYKMDSDEPNAITSIKHREVHEPSFSVGILATKQIKEKWGLQTGLVYSNTAIGISPQKLYAFQDPAGDIAYKFITSSGYTYIKPGFGAAPSFGDSITATEATHTLHFLSIPAVIKYTVGRNKFLFIPGAGIEANFITSAKLETEIEDAANHETVFIDKLNGSKSFYWSFVADAELRYVINKKLAFSIRPVFRYAISPITENNVVETFPYSFGAGLGIVYKF